MDYIKDLESIGFVGIDNSKDYVFNNENGLPKFILRYSDVYKMFTMFRVINETYEESELKLHGLPLIYVLTEYYIEIARTVKEYFSKNGDLVIIPCKLRDEILNTYKWIKVNRFDTKIEDLKADPNTYWQNEYEMLLEHHQKETEFLINFVRKIVE